MSSGQKSLISYFKRKEDINNNSNNIYPLHQTDSKSSGKCETGDFSTKYMDTFSAHKIVRK